MRHALSCSWLMMLRLLLLLLLLLRPLKVHPFMCWFCKSCFALSFVLFLFPSLLRRHSCRSSSSGISSGIQCTFIVTPTFCRGCFVDDADKYYSNPSPSHRAACLEDIVITHPPPPSQSSHRCIRLLSLPFHATRRHIMSCLLPLPRGSSTPSSSSSGNATHHHRPFIQSEPCHAHQEPCDVSAQTLSPTQSSYSNGSLFPVFF